MAFQPLFRLGTSGANDGGYHSLLAFWLGGVGIPPAGAPAPGRVHDSGIWPPQTESERQWRQRQKREILEDQKADLLARVPEPELDELEIFELQELREIRDIIRIAKRKDYN